MASAFLGALMNIVQVLPLEGNPLRLSGALLAIINMVLILVLVLLAESLLVVNHREG